MQIRRFLLVVSLVALAACLPVKNAANPDGSAMSQGATARSAQPVTEDGVTMKDGMMLAIKDGQMSRMQEDLEYDDGTTVKTDGTVILADGTTLVLPEGMMITMDGRLQMRGEFVVQGNPVITTPAPEGAGATYTDYTADVLMNGETKVLFFAASWCPECKKANAYLESVLPSSEYSRSVYKVDYDTAKDLKAKYNVVYQHTFVVVDGSGVKISSVQGPTEAQIAALLK